MNRPFHLLGLSWLAAIFAAGLGVPPLLGLGLGGLGLGAAACLGRLNRRWGALLLGLALGFASLAAYHQQVLDPLRPWEGRTAQLTGVDDARMARCGAKAGACGIEMITLENGAILKSIHGNAARNSVGYSIYGSKGRMESAREDAQNGDFTRIYRNCDEYEGQNNGEVVTYEPTDDLAEKAKAFGHGSSDFYTMYNFIEKIRGNQNADVIGVYEALDMFLPGMFAYRSVLNGGIPMEIPNLRNKAERDLWRHDTMCTDPKVAGDQLIPSYSKGNPDIEEAIYAGIRDAWIRSLEETK